MPATLEFFFDYGSPWSYYAFTQVPKVAQAAGAQVLYRPMLLGGVFKATGNQSPAEINVSAKRASVLSRAGFDAQAFQAAIDRADVKQRLRATTDEAVSRGVFGAPTFFVGNEMFFGQDRLDFVAGALRAA